MRSERLCLTDIVEAATAIATFLDGLAEDAFVGDDLRRSAVLQKLSIIGEAAARLPQSFRNRHTEIPWQDIIGFRNIAVHAYFAVDWRIVWATAQDDVPPLRDAATRRCGQDSF